MKKNLLKILALSALFVVGGSISVVQNNTPTRLEAAQFLDDYDPYTYQGSYYSKIDFDAADGMNGALRQSLTTLIRPKGFYTYGSSGTNHLSTQLQYADEDPNNSANMVYLYTRDSVQKNSASSWNREHVWPQSLSNGNWGTDGGGTDVLHIRPTYNKTNQVRDNYKYGDTSKTGPLTYNNMLYGYLSNNYFEPLDEVKGDVARIIMYVWTTYTGYPNYNTLNVLSVFQSYDTLLKWHTADKPDALEGNRNNYAEQSIQENRNPFVDHPELAWRIFGDQASSSVKNACMEAYPADGYNPNQKQLTGISISGQANKKDYYVGESFDPTGLTVTASYSDNTSKTVTNSSCTWTPDPLTEGLTSVTCKYGNYTATYSGITVSKREGVGGEYKVEFVNGSDSGTNITNSNIATYVKTNTLFESVSDIAKIFPGTYGLKFGSSSADGAITFNLVGSAQADIIKITIESNAYSGKGSYTVKLGNTTLGTDISAGETFVKSMSKTTAKSLTINSTGRMYICSIAIEIASPTQPSSSSNPPVSSEPSYSCIDTNSSSISQEPSSIPESIESSVISGEEVVSSVVEQSSNSEVTPAPDQKKGCNGSFIASASLLGISALLGLVFVFSKKK